MGEIELLGLPVDDEMERLLTAVDALTLPQQERVQQFVASDVSPLCRPSCKGRGPHAHASTVTLEPLLVQLHEVVRGALKINVGGPGASLKFTRGVVDSEALMQLVRISSQITDWARMVKAPRRRTPVEQLRAWFVVYRQQNPAESSVRVSRLMLQRWAATIRARLDPTVEVALPDPCPNPECPQGFDEHTGRPIWWDPKSREACTNPLVVSYRPSEGNRMVERAKARCRACGSSWTVRELSWELEQARSANV